MQSTGLNRARLVAAAAFGMALLVSASAAGAAPAAAAPAPDRSALEQQLKAARAELEAAAREVADLSRQLYGDGGSDVMRFLEGGPRGSMLGVNLGTGDAREDGVAVAGVSPGGPACRAESAVGAPYLPAEPSSTRVPQVVGLSSLRVATLETMLCCTAAPALSLSDSESANPKL